MNEIIDIKTEVKPYTISYKLTPEQEAANQKAIALIELDKLDIKSGATRTIRCLALAAGQKAGFSDDENNPNFNEEYKILNDYETEAKNLRKRIRSLQDNTQKNTVKQA